MNTLLFCTVVGGAEPIVATLRHWRPVRVKFVVTPGTKGKMAEILARAREEGVDLDDGQYDLLEIPDEEDLEGCFEYFQGLTEGVFEWVECGDDFQVVVDITGGTKCMIAAMAIQSSYWPCVFSYVGGKARTKDGGGIVASRLEMVRQAEIPWRRSS